MEIFYYLLGMAVGVCIGRIWTLNEYAGKLDKLVRKLDKLEKEIK